jgi:hypothetical protein
MYESLAPISFFLTNWKFLDLKKVSKSSDLCFKGPGVMHEVGGA